MSIGNGSAAFQRSLCTLMKAGYQQTVLATLARHGSRRPGDRFSVLACDEYAQVATEGNSGLVSDSSFEELHAFAQAVQDDLSGSPYPPYLPTRTTVLTLPPSSGISCCVTPPRRGARRRTPPARTEPGRPVLRRARSA